MKQTALVPLMTYPTHATVADLGAVADFARRIGCDIHVVALVVHFPKVANALSGLLLDVPDMVRRAELGSRKAATELVAALKERASAGGVGFGAHERAAGPEIAGDIAAEEARYFDLSLIPMASSTAESRAMAEAVVFGSGRPALLLPQTLAGADPHHAVIAWDGSRVAARAAADLLAVVGTPKRVTVLSVLNEKPLPANAEGDRLVAHLARRGISAGSKTIELEDQPIGRSLQDFAVSEGAGLLVMGAYGHSRLRDFVLGGATRTILADLRLPVLMSH